MRGFLLVAALVAVLVFVGVGLAAGPPPAPTAVGGRAVQVLARGVPTPVAFAFGAGHVFVGAFGNEEKPTPVGGVFLLGGPRPLRLAGSPAHVAGVAWDEGTLYVSAFPARILAWSGWNGSRFTRRRVVAVGPKGASGFSGFNGIAVGPDHKIYVGVSLAGDTRTADYLHGRGPYANSFLRVDPRTGKLEWLATGMRQPWQPLFVPGLKGPLVSDLGQENLGKKRPPDRILMIEPGLDFGFPACPASPKACKQYAKPFKLFPAHSSPMGMAVIGARLYVALFGGLGQGPTVVSMPKAGGAYRPFLNGFVAPVLAVAAHAGSLYVGDLTGSVYTVTP